MAAGDVLQKRQGSFGIAYESVPGTAEALPVYTIICDDANIAIDPVRYERINNVSAESIGIEEAGYDPGFSFSGAEINGETMGYLCWLLLGAVATVTSTHTVTPQFDSQYVTAFKDHGGIFNTTFRTERCVESRFDSLSIDQQKMQYAKISGSGIGLSVDPMATALTPVVGLTAAAAPLSWNALRAGSFNLNWAGAGLSATTAITSLKIDIGREVARAGADLNSDQGSEVVQGGREVTFEFTLDLKDAGADIAAAYLAMKNGDTVGMSATWLMGTTTFTVVITEAKVTNSVPGPLGTGAESQEWTVQAKAYQTDGNDVISVVTNDGNTALYTAR